MLLRFFFFQAEDGIRDIGVTGVQTCALPIYQLKAYLNDQLQALSQADIGTMDAFAQKLVHQHGYVLGISPHFRIIQDKAEQDILKREVFSQVFEAYMAQADNKDFIQLVQNFSGRRKDSSAFRRSEERRVGKEC